MAEHRFLLLYGAQVEIMGLSRGIRGMRRNGCWTGAGQGGRKTGRDNSATAEIVVRSNVVRPESHPFYEKIGYERKKTQHVYARSAGEGASA